MEAILVIPTMEALEAFKHFDADLDDSPDPIPAYGLAANMSFEVPLEGELLLDRDSQLPI